MDELREVLRMTKATDVVYLDGDYKESASGHVETTSHKYACKINGRPHLVEISWVTNYYRNASNQADITEQRQISGEEYDRLVAGKAQMDTPEVLAKLARIDRLEAAKNALVPRCPQCQAMMVERSSRRGEFWGCKRFPHCRGTRDISTAYLAAKQALSNP